MDVLVAYVFVNLNISFGFCVSIMERRQVLILRKLDVIFFQNARTLKTEMFCYPCIKTPKSQPSKNVEKQNMHCIKALMCTNVLASTVF